MRTAEEQISDLMREREILVKKNEELLVANKQLYTKVQEEKAKCETWRDCIEIITEKFADKL